MKKKNKDIKKMAAKRPTSRRVLTGKARRFASYQEFLKRSDITPYLRSKLDSLLETQIVSVETVSLKLVYHRRLITALKVVTDDGSKHVIYDPDFPFPKDPDSKKNINTARLIKKAKRVAKLVKL